MAPLLADFRALRARMQQQGLFCSNKAYYAFKLATNLSILAGAMLTLALGASSWWLLLTSAFLLGLFWQQTGQRQTPVTSFWLLLSSYSVKTKASVKSCVACRQQPAGTGLLCPLRILSFPPARKQALMLYPTAFKEV